MKRVTLTLVPPFLIISIVAISIIIATLIFLLIKQADAQEFRSANVEFNTLAIDEDRCPGVLVYPGTRSGSENAYYYLIKPYPKMNIDFEDVAYIPSFRKEGESRSFFYAIYFPSYNETNPFDEYADIPCGKDQLKREIYTVIPKHEKPENPDDINLSRIKINTLSFSIPQYYKDLGFELIYDSALSDSQNAGVIYSRSTFIIELRVPDIEFEKLLEILRSDIGFPLTIMMGFRAKEQLDYKEAYVDIGSLMMELKAKLGGESKQYFAKAQVSQAIKTSSSFANIQIYGESSNVDQWIANVLIPMLSTYTAGSQKSTSSKPSGSEPYSPYKPPYSPYTPPSPKPSPQPAGEDKVYLDLSGNFESDVKKFTFRSDVLNPNASQEYLTYQYPLKYYGEIDGNYFVLESNRYEENERYTQIYLETGETLEFTIEGYWKVSPKLMRKKYYYNEYHLNSSKIPYLFTKNNPQFKIEDNTGELYVYGTNMLLPPTSIGGKALSSYTKIGRVELEPVSWGNGYFPKYFNWTPIFPATSKSTDEPSLKYKNLKGTNLFDVKVPLNNLRPYSIEELLSMIPLGVRFWKGKSIPISDILNDPTGELYNEISRDYFDISFSRIRKTVMITAKTEGHLYFENLDFVEPSLELKPRDSINPELDTDGGEGWKYISKEDLIGIDERLFTEIETKNYAKIQKYTEKRSRRGVYNESEKPLQYDYIHSYPAGVLQSFSRGATIRSEVFFPLENPKVETRTYIKLKLFDN